MGTTVSGLRYPEPTDPVNQGATAIKNLALDVNGRYIQQYVGATQSISIPANGRVLFVAALTVPAVQWNRLILADYRGLCTVLPATNYSDLLLLLNSANVSTVRTNGPGNPHGFYTAIQPAGTATTWQVDASANAAATYSPNAAFGALNLIAIPLST